MRRQIIFLVMVLGAFFIRLDSIDAVNISNSRNPSENVDIAINGTGEIGAVWVEEISTANQKVYFSIFASKSWSSPAVIPGQSAISAYPRIAKGINGGFVAVWHDQTSNCIRFSQYQGSWSTPIVVSPVGGYDFGWPAVTTTTNGRIAVGWMRGNPTFSDIFVTIFQTSWSSPVNVSKTPYGSKYCDLASGPNGEIYVIWQDDRGNDVFRPLLNSDQGNGSWLQFSEINDIKGWCFRPSLAVNALNNMLVCYYYHNKSSYWGSYRMSGDWRDPMVYSDIGNHQDHALYFSDACPYEEDSFLYVYRDCSLNIFYALAQDGNPGTSVALTSSSRCYYPSIDYDPALGAAAAWTDRSGNCDVYVAVFDPQTGNPGSGIQPPLNLMADYRNIALAPAEVKTEMIVNRNLFTLQYFWKISWAPDSRWSEWGVVIAKYRVYRKLKTNTFWQLHAELDPTALFFVDTDSVSQEDRFDYKVRAVDGLGNEYYAYNHISWSPNPVNTDRQITIKGYNIYRKLSAQPAASFSIWKTVDAATLVWEDHATEIRQQTNYDYALTAISDNDKESAKAVAQKTFTSTAKSRKH